VQACNRHAERQGGRIFVQLTFLAGSGQQIIGIRHYAVDGERI